MLVSAAACLVSLSLSAMVAADSMYRRQSSPPSCAASCFSSPGCTSSSTCYCSDSSLIYNVGYCIGSRCSSSDITAAIQYLENTCLGSFSLSGLPTASRYSYGPSGTSYTSQTASSSRSRGPPIGAIVGGVVGGVAFIAIVGVVTFLLIRRSRNNKVQNQYVPSPMAQNQNAYGGAPGPSIPPAPSASPSATHPHNSFVAGPASTASGFTSSTNQPLMGSGPYGQSGPQNQQQSYSQAGAAPYSYPQQNNYTPYDQSSGQDATPYNPQQYGSPYGAGAEQRVNNSITYSSGAQNPGPSSPTGYYNAGGAPLPATSTPLSPAPEYGDRNQYTYSDDKRAPLTLSHQPPTQ